MRVEILREVDDLIKSSMGGQEYAMGFETLTK